MDRRAATTQLDPAAAVSGLLTRLGLFLLVVLAPTLAMTWRRAVPVLVPVATALLILAAVLDGRLSPALSRFGRALAGPTTLALAVLLAWAGVSTAWSPSAGALLRLPGLIANAALFGAAIACMRQNARVSDVNLIPVGVAVAAVALALVCLPASRLASLLDADPAGQESLRAAMLLSLLAWPGAAALVLRGRLWQAGVLCLVVALALWLVHDLVVISAFIVGAAVFVAASLRPRPAIRFVGAGLCALLILAPAIGWLMANYGGFLLPSEGDALVAVWRDVTYSLPAHGLQGFGFDASRALTRGVGGVPLQSPRNAALQLWLELGLVGVVLAGLALAMALRAVERADPQGQAAALAVYAGAGVMMFSGLAAWQPWWITSLGLTAISLAFVARRASRRY